MSATPAPGDGPERTEAAERILLTAKRLFAERGYDGVSIRDIAAEAEVSKANVFHHFSSKWELYRAVMEDSSGAFQALLARLPEHDAATAELLQQFAAGHMRCLFGDADAGRLFIRQLLDKHEGEGRQLAENLVEENFRQALQRLRQMQQQGRLRADADPAQIALLLGGVNVAAFELQHVLRRSGAGELLDDPEAFAAGIVRLLTQGILPRNDH